MGEVTYSSYLRLDELLSLQQPYSPESARRQRAAEHFFIVTHQSSELWLRQLLLDLEEAADALGPPHMELELALEHLERVGHVAQVLVDHVALLAKLPLSCFAAFRRSLGTASAAQSEQFHAVARALGLRGRRGNVYPAFLAAVDASGLTLEEVYRDELSAAPLYRIAETLLDVDYRLWKWHVVHVEVVARLLGSTSGTGGTAGVRYLIDRMAGAFPELWEVRGALHDGQPPVTASLAS